MPRSTAVYLEVGPKRAFAGAVDWPGWCRAGRNPDQALEALVAYAPRYAAAIASAEAGFAAPGGKADLEVIERLQGGSGTDFGVPSEAPRADVRLLADAELARQTLLLRACWAAFDAAAAAAVGKELRKGPRGGGRDLDKMVSHVLEAEEAYLRQLGSRTPKPSDGAPDARMQRVRDRAVEALAARARGETPPDPNQVRRLWSPRYFVRRSAWHVLDHAWEIQDRVTPVG